MRLPSPMLARSGPIPSGDYAFELKWDGFRAMVSRNCEFRVRSRRGWNMTPLIPELGELPVHGLFDGELVAFAEGRPHFPLVCDRLLHRDNTIPLTYVIFDVLELDCEPMITVPYWERRAALDELELGAGPWFVAETFDDGAALFAAVCDQGLEGIVAKRRGQRYRPGAPGSRRRTGTTGVTARSWNPCGAALFAPRARLWREQRVTPSGVRRFTRSPIRGVSMRIALALRRLGISSDVLHDAGFGSIVAAISLWGHSAVVDDWKAKARAERLAIFIGLWPPTFFLLGKVLQDLEASPAQQVLRARGVDESQLDQALRHEAAAATSA
jgi:ATP dependent DNA ligase domain